MRISVGYNVNIVRKLAEWRNSLAEMGVQPDGLSDYIRKKGPLEKQISDLEKERRRVIDITKEWRSEIASLKRRGFSLQTEINNLSIYREELERKKREAEAKVNKEIDEMQKRVETLRALPARMVRNRFSAQTPNAVTWEIPIDAEGKPCKPENAVSIKQSITPIAPQENLTDKMARENLEEKLDAANKKYEVLKNEEKKRMEQQIVIVKKLEAKFDAQAKKYEELKNKMSDEEKKRMQKQLISMDNDLKDLRAQLTSDTYKKMTKGITALGDRKPLKEVGELIKELATPHACCDQLLSLHLPPPP